MMFGLWFSLKVHELQIGKSVENERANAGRKSRTRLARLSSDARTKAGKIHSRSQLPGRYVADAVRDS